ncbi:hypothetical protein DOTSEDRAFT_178989 [Dothistroma septosporum NZE10]|uniref:Branched-chain-amino-acid transaminase n=1 Tax=Dothistroma septosporum (strain NZE10 / CBS 128990) TaxID=675120 RepID=N1PCP5_DOTSN|nr:hypothetical protein DOTSEDRAFT_178989 [Dothistroma septosporum NZE10]
MTGNVTSPQGDPVSGRLDENGQSAGLLDASRLAYQLTSTPRVIPAPHSPELWAQGEATDHMIMARYNAIEGGWSAPQLVPYGPLSLMPTAAVLHYATECFEGLKLYRGMDGRIRLFRPQHNAQRMRDSAARVSLPDFPAEELVRLIAKLAATDAPRWLPKDRPGTYLYVRPTLIATQPSLAIKKASEALLYIILICFPDFDQPTRGLRLLASGRDRIRAWPGGFGNCKVGANYGPSIVASAAAASQGYDQVLWLFGAEEYVTEAGACNFFAVIQPKDGTGKAQLLTAPLGDAVVLPGVTRTSILETVKTMLATEFEVVERNYSIHELIEAANSGSLSECFVSGTAFFITPVGEIGFGDSKLKVPGLDGSDSLVKRLRDVLWAIMYGEIEHPWAYIVHEHELRD